VGETLQAGAGEIGLLVQDEFEIAGQRGFDPVPPSSLSPWAAWGSPTEK